MIGVLQQEKADKDKQLIEKNPHEELLDQNNKSLEEIKEKHDDWNLIFFLYPFFLYILVYWK